MSTLTNKKIKDLVKGLRFPNKGGMEALVKELNKTIDDKKAGAVVNLNLTIAATPSQAHVQAISNKVDELLTALRAAGLLS
jgi:hypothetical protein